jgi:nitrile hydratase accessory protein
LNAPNDTTDNALGPLKRKDGEPIFDEAWQAQVLAMADSLTRQGAFTPGEWSETLGAELRRAEADGAQDDAETYYQAALRALESLLDGGGAVSVEVVTERRDAWERAYLATPHGQPVTLKSVSGK